jgi:hypothetical protein
MPLAVLASATAGAINTLSANGLMFIVFYLFVDLLIITLRSN